MGWTIPLVPRDRARTDPAAVSASCRHAAVALMVFVLSPMPAVLASPAAADGRHHDVARSSRAAGVLNARPIRVSAPVSLPRLLPPPPLPPQQDAGAASSDTESPAVAAPEPQDGGQRPSARLATRPAADAADVPAYVEPPDVTPESKPANTVTTSGAPRQVGMEPEDGQSFFGTWVLPTGLRGALTAGFGGGTSVYQGQADTNEHSSEWSAEAAGSVAFLDRRVFSIDYSAGIQKAGAGSATPSAESRNSIRVTNLGLSANVLSGRSMPLRVFAGRTSAGSATGVSLQGLPEKVQDVTGSHSTVGVTWDLAVPRLPKIHLSATRDSDSQVRNFLFGQSQWTTQQRAEARATGSRPRFGYDATYRFDDYNLDIPEVGLQSRTTQQMLTGAVRLEPTPKWRVDLDGRANQFQLGRSSSNGGVRGLGVNASVRFAPTGRLFTSFRYALSTSLSEAVLSGNVDALQAGVEGAGSASLGSRIATDELEGRVGYVRQTGALELFARSFTLGAPATGPPTLSQQRSAGATVRGQRPLAGFQLSGSIEGEVGTAFSTHGASEPFQSGSGQLSVSRQAGRLLRLSLDGYAQRSSRLTFYMVPPAARSGGARVETLLPEWARITATVRWSSVLRDAIYNDYNDKFTAWSVGVAGRSYGLTVAVDRGDAHSLLLSPGLLDRRVDLAIVQAREPGLLGAFMASASRSRQVTARFEPWRSLQVRGFVQRESRQNFGLYDQDSEGAQVSVVYALRQVQLEAGWNRYSILSTLASGRYENKRFFVRVRRDISFF